MDDLVAAAPPLVRACDMEMLALLKAVTAYEFDPLAQPVIEFDNSAIQYGLEVAREEWRLDYPGLPAPDDLARELCWRIPSVRGLVEQRLLEAGLSFAKSISTFRHWSQVEDVSPTSGRNALDLTFTQVILRQQVAAEHDCEVPDDDVDADEGLPPLTHALDGASSDTPPGPIQVVRMVKVAERRGVEVLSPQFVFEADVPAQLRVLWPRPTDLLPVFDIQEYTNRAFANKGRRLHPGFIAEVLVRATRDLRRFSKRPMFRVSFMIDFWQLILMRDMTAEQRAYVREARSAAARADLLQADVDDYLVGHDCGRNAHPRRGRSSSDIPAPTAARIANRYDYYRVFTPPGDNDVVCMPPFPRDGSTGGLVRSLLVSTDQTKWMDTFMPLRSMSKEWAVYVSDPAGSLERKFSGPACDRVPLMEVLRSNHTAARMRAHFVDTAEVGVWSLPAIPADEFALLLAACPTSGAELRRECLLQPLMLMFRRTLVANGACLPEYIDAATSRRRVAGIAMVSVAVILRIVSDDDFDVMGADQIKSALDACTLDDPDWAAAKDTVLRAKALHESRVDDAVITRTVKQMMMSLRFPYIVTIVERVGISPVVDVAEAMYKGDSQSVWPAIARAVVWGKPPAVVPPPMFVTPISTTHVEVVRAALGAVLTAVSHRPLSYDAAARLRDLDIPSTGSVTRLVMTASVVSEALRNQNVPVGLPPTGLEECNIDRVIYSIEQRIKDVASDLMFDLP